MKDSSLSGMIDRGAFEVVARTHEWGATPLGPIAAWPPSLSIIFDMMLASGHAMCVIWGPEQTLLYNAAYAPLMGERHPGGMGIPVGDAWPEIRDDIAPLVARTYAGETLTFEGLHLLMTRHGYPEDTWWDFSYSPLRDETGKVAGLLNTTLEATGRIVAERDLGQLNRTLEHRVEERSRELTVADDRVRQMQKMEAIGQLTGGVAHDFNNLLTIIRSSAELLGRKELTAERQQRYVDAISSTADRAAKLTGQLLAFARRQALRPETFDVAERVEALADMLRSVVGSRIELVVEPKCSPCFVEVDVSQFETALVNLVANARDAMDGSGRITVRVKQADAVPPLRGHAGTAGDFVTVAVVDDGPGLPADQLDRVFEPFYTTKEVGKGTGLGLSQVYGFTKQSGGDIEVESEKGRGAAFRLYLPKTDAPITVATAMATAPVAEAEASILVVEDNEQVGEFASQLLQDLGYTTRYVPNAREALSLLEKESSTIDILFSDVIMPGIDGVELGRRVRERWPAITIVLTSGYSHVLAQDAHHGFDLLHKPYSVDELSKVLTDARRKKASAAG